MADWPFCCTLHTVQKARRLNPADFQLSIPTNPTLDAAAEMLSLAAASAVAAAAAAVWARRPNSCHHRAILAPAPFKSQRSQKV